MIVIACRKGAKTPLDEWPLGRSLLTELEQTYPAMDVLGEIQRSRLWLDANPEKRKTFDGMRRFVTGWLSRAHDSGKYIRRAPALVGGDRAPEASRRPKVGDLDRSGQWRYDGVDWQPVTKAPSGGDAA